MSEKDPLGIVGQLIDEKYRVEGFVGEGGFAVVYRAEHVVWYRPVALKFFSNLAHVPAENREALQRDFIREGALLAELSSRTAGIVQARDAGTFAAPSGQSMPYMVLEWLDGLPLDAVLDRDQAEGVAWNEDQVLGFLIRLLAILEVAHERGISHRDIKPANVFVMGSAPRSPATPLKLLDFGVAKMVAEHTATKAALATTGVGLTSFTPNYGAPEQFTRSHGATGPWTDVYTTALVASEMLVGRTVLEGEDVVQLSVATANPARRPTPRALGAVVSDAMEAMLAKALAVRPEDRFASAGEFLRACLTLARERGVSVWPGLPLEAVEPVQMPPNPALPRRASLLVRAGGLHDTQHAAASTVAPPGQHRESPLGVALVIVIAVLGGTLVYSATDLSGASRLRAVVLALARAGQRLVGLSHDEAARAQAASPRFDGARFTPDGAGRSLRAVGPAPVQSPVAAAAKECPKGTLGVPLEDVPGVLCIGEQPVRGADYASCAPCRAEQAGSVAERTAAAGGANPGCTLSEGSPGDGRACATAQQALTFCSARHSRLPTQQELEAFAALKKQPSSRPMDEWTVSKAEAFGGERRAFRCASFAE